MLGQTIERFRGACIGGKGGDWSGGQSDFEIALNDTYYGGSHFGFSFAGGWRGCAATPDTAWHHYAAVVVNGQDDPSLYIDGVPQAIIYRDGQETINLSASTLPLHLGAQVDPINGWNYYSETIIDEVSLYSRGLTAAEIQGLYEAGALGKCAVPPTLVSQPGAQQVTAGNDAVLQVSAAGSSLSYQWYRNGEAVSGATGPILYLPNVQAADAGTYTVQVANSSGGSVTSDGAVLTVAAPVAVATPSGAVAWWRCEGIDEDRTVEDTIGNNPAQAANESFWCDPNGKVGGALVFGVYTDLLIPHKDAGGLDSASWDGFTIEGWIKRTDILTVPPASPEAIMEQWDSATSRRITLSISAAGRGSLDVTYVNSDGIPHQLSSLPGTFRAATSQHDAAFQHVALAYKDHLGVTSLELYLNGKLVAANDAHLELALGTNDLHFGYSPSGAVTEHFGGGYPANSGWMDELTIYNRALGESEIQGIYNAGSAGKIPPCTPAPSGCVGWWQGERNGSDVYALNPAVPWGTAI